MNTQVDSKCPVHHYPRYLVRFVHLTTSLFTFTVLTLDMLYDFCSYEVARNDKTFKFLQSFCGIGMILSGLILTYMMKKETTVESQQFWLQKLTLKFYLSLMLTPFFDKIGLAVFGQ